MSSVDGRLLVCCVSVIFLSLLSDAETTPSSAFSTVLPTRRPTVDRPPSRAEGKVKKNDSVEAIRERIKSMNLSTQAKMQRLKELRAEARLLAAQLKRQRQGGQRDDPLTADSDWNSTDERFTRWQKKMRHRVRTILKRLHKLEKQIKLQKQTLKAAQLHKRGKHRQYDHRVVVPTQIVSAETTVTKRPNRKMVVRTKKPKKTTLADYVRTTMTPLAQLSSTSRRLDVFHQARNKSKNGEHGGTCSSHKECRPGLCCHKTSGNASAACVRYALKEGEICEHSCACESHLQCFRDAAPDVNGKPKPARCKKASPRDLLNGTYENAKNAVFEQQRKERRRRRELERRRKLQILRPFPI
ncbi:hypothetical protein AAVH_26022 [Aphelenchoides avenae]|nr:hypothetical protein AAVH_26022 [Aphelenchus avenae]